jgi:hypothetical protein
MLNELESTKYCCGISGSRRPVEYCGIGAEFNSGCRERAGGDDDDDDDDDDDMELRVWQALR